MHEKFFVWSIFLKKKPRQAHWTKIARVDH